MEPHALVREHPQRYNPTKATPSVVGAPSRTRRRRSISRGSRQVAGERERKCPTRTLAGAGDLVSGDVRELPPAPHRKVKRVSRAEIEDDLRIGTDRPEVTRALLLSHRRCTRAEEPKMSSATRCFCNVRMIVIVTLMATLYYAAVIDTAAIRPEVRAH